MNAPTHDSWRARLRRARHPGMGFCGRCGDPWNPRTPNWHATPYGYTDGDPLIDGYSNSRACFPLCVHCWARLTIDERIPYYFDLIACWIAGATDAHMPDAAKVAEVVAATRRDGDHILAAVRAGL